MAHRIVAFADRPEIRDDINVISDAIWPEYNMHGDVLNKYWGGLYEVFPRFQFVLYDEDADEVLASGNSLACRWNGSADDLPEGIDAVVEQGFRDHDEGLAPNTLSALAIGVAPANRGRGLSRVMVQAMTAIAAAHDLDNLIAPVRPNFKDRYPLTPIERYMHWTREDGLPFDPWIRVHRRLGAHVVKPAPRSLRITGTVAEWERWTGLVFPDSGDYMIPRGLAPLTIARGDDLGTYWEPNVWMQHRVS